LILILKLEGKSLSGENKTFSFRMAERTPAYLFGFPIGAIIDPSWLDQVNGLLPIAYFDVHCRSDIL
jgi:hypothetical protein